MYFRKLNNEWFTGLCYEYNAEQDTTRKEIKRLIDSGDFVDDTDYDFEGVSTIPFKVRYKHYSDTQSRRTYGQTGEKTTRAHRIETSDQSYEFKYKDRFKLITQSDDEKPYMIVNVEYNKNTHNAKRALLLPGLAKESTPKTVLTLR